MIPRTIYDSREWRRLERERRGLVLAMFRDPHIFSADQKRALRRVRDRQEVLERYEHDAGMRRYRRGWRWDRSVGVLVCVGRRAP